MHFKERRRIYKLYRSLLAFVFPQGMTLRDVRRETRSRGSVKTLWDTLYGWSMHVGSAQAGLPDRVTSARLLRGAVERKRNRLAKEKKSSSACDSRYLNPAAGRLNPRIVGPCHRGARELHAVGRLKGMKITKRREDSLVSFPCGLA